MMSSSVCSIDLCKIPFCWMMGQKDQGSHLDKCPCQSRWHYWRSPHGQPHGHFFLKVVELPQPLIFVYSMGQPVFVCAEQSVYDIGEAHCCIVIFIHSWCNAYVAKTPPPPPPPVLLMNSAMYIHIMLISINSKCKQYSYIINAHTKYNYLIQYHHFW